MRKRKKKMNFGVKSSEEQSVLSERKRTGRPNEEER